MNTWDVINDIILRNPDIDQLSFHRFPPSVMIQDETKDWGKEEDMVFNRAMKLKQTLHFPFWSGIMISSFDNPFFPESLLKSALHHNTIENLQFVDVRALNKFDNESNALCSIVRKVNGKEEHIPMMDFHISPSHNNLRIVKSVCSCLELRSGWILDSGESYHFIGSNSIPWDALYIRLSASLVFNPIVDIAWISHQLREKCCSLRIGKKNGRYPEVICEL